MMMEMTFKKTAVQFTAFTLLIIPATLLVDFLIPSLKASDNWPAILFFMYLFTMGVLYLLVSSVKKRMVRFVNTYLLVSFGKMMLYVVIMFVYAWLNPANAVPFILTFLAYYIIFLIYEVVVLLHIS